jgi:hypothetical protein
MNPAAPSRSLTRTAGTWHITATPPSSSRPLPLMSSPPLPFARGAHTPSYALGHCMHMLMRVRVQHVRTCHSGLTHAHRICPHAHTSSTITYHGVCLTVWSHADTERGAAIRHTLGGLWCVHWSRLGCRCGNGCVCWCGDRNSVCVGVGTGMRLGACVGVGMGTRACVGSGMGMGVGTGVGKGHGHGIG